MKRLWHRPDDPTKSSATMIIWAGSPGCGKSVAVSEVVLECILKLQELGKDNKQTKWQFFLRNGRFLTRYYFDSNLDRVSHDLRTFKDRSDILEY